MPEPGHLVAGAGVYRLDDATTVLLDAPVASQPALLDAVGLLPMRLRRASERHAAGQLRVRVARGLTVAEGYRLDVGPDGISVEAHDVAGVVYAIQTLRQLLDADAYRREPAHAGPWDVPAVQIEDSPRFAWRGAMIDVARHFLPKQELLRQIELLAAHKFNRVQLHLTDDQGWRIESAAYPLLHEVGSVRSQTQVNHHDDTPAFDGTPHGGCYTRDDLREIVAFARRRAVTVVPELSLPGHTGALLGAYPEFGSPPDRSREVLTTWGCHDAVLSPLPHTLKFLEALFGEVLEIFDSPWVHVGGDEPNLGPWVVDADVRRYADEQKLAGPADVYARLLDDVERILRRGGRRMVAWDEAFATVANAQSPAIADHVATIWRDVEVGRRAAAAGHDVVLAPVLRTYFDYSQSDDEREPLAIGGPITLADVATWEPVPAAWSAEESARVLGVQCQMWSELTATPRAVDYMLWPRAAALAQVAWAGTAASFDDVAPRLRAHLARLAAAGVEHRPWDGPAGWQAGGTGRRAFRAPMAMDKLEQLLREDVEKAPAGEWPAADRASSVA